MKASPITLEALQVLDAIERRGSFAAAAEQLNKVPSALSYIVQKLEEQLGVTLFQKQGRRSVLTPAGKHLLKEGRQLLNAVEQLADKTVSIATGWEPKLNIAIDSLFDPLPIFKVIQQFLDKYPHIEIDIREEVMSGAWEVLIEDKVDLLIGGPAPVPQQKGIHAVRFGNFEPVFAVSPNHPLAKLPQPIPNSKINDYITVVVHDSAQTSIPWSAGIIGEKHHFYVASTEYKIKAQLAGIGCGYLPRSRIQPFLDSGELVELQIEADSRQFDTYMAWKLVNRGKALQALREMLQQALCNNHSEPH